MPLRGERPDRPTYQILGPLPGGKGLIVVANHRIFGRLCVQKTVDMRAKDGDLAFMEPRLLDRINHPQITPIGEVQFDPQRDNAVTFIMPLYEGGSVENALQEGYVFSVREAITIAADILDALAYVHAANGYVHRDIKPGNVLMHPSRDRGFLADFGSAARAEADGQAPAILGTLPYLPPEALATKRVGVPGDIYGVAFTLFEMLNGRLRWEELELAQVQARLLAGRRSVPDGALERWAPHVPERLRRSVRKGLRKDPSRRFASARAFLNELLGTRCIDWKDPRSEGPDSEWAGTWPPHLPRERRATYRVTSRMLRGGPQRGMRRLEAHYRRSGVTRWRRAGVPDATVDPGDLAAASQFFAAVEARAAQRAPAR